MQQTHPVVVLFLHEITFYLLFKVLFCFKCRTFDYLLVFIDSDVMISKGLTVCTK